MNNKFAPVFEISWINFSLQWARKFKFKLILNEHEAWKNFEVIAKNEKEWHNDNNSQLINKAMVKNASAEKKIEKKDANNAMKCEWKSWKRTLSEIKKVNFGSYKNVKIRQMSAENYEIKDFSISFATAELWMFSIADFSSLFLLRRLQNWSCIISLTSER